DNRANMIVPALTREAQIKRGLRSHLTRLGFRKDASGHLCPPTDSKEAFRRMHQPQRAKRLAGEKPFIRANWKLLRNYFANGVDVDPWSIAPRLEVVEAGTPQSNLFRLASLLWSIPVSAGYGRS